MDAELDPVVIEQIDAPIGCDYDGCSAAVGWSVKCRSCENLRLMCTDHKENLVDRADYALTLDSIFPIILTCKG